MVDERTLLLAIDNHETLFDKVDDLLDSDNHLDVFAVVGGQTSQSEIAQDAEVGQSTVSRALSTLKKSKLIEENDEGQYTKTMPVLNHPLMKEFWRSWRESDGG